MDTLLINQCLGCCTALRHVRVLIGKPLLVVPTPCEERPTKRFLPPYRPRFTRRRNQSRNWHVGCKNCFFRNITGLEVGGSMTWYTRETSYRPTGNLLLCAYREYTSNIRTLRHSNLVKYSISPCCLPQPHTSCASPHSILWLVPHEQANFHSKPSRGHRWFLPGATSAPLV